VELVCGKNGRELEAEDDTRIEEAGVRETQQALF